MGLWVDFERGGGMGVLTIRMESSEITCCWVDGFLDKSISLSGQHWQKKA